MCGIAGYIGEGTVPPENVGTTLRRMRNRGPDHQGFLEIDAGGFRVFLLHSRLSIIDLDPRANQPFRIGECALVYNGEIYNYLEIREELEKRGVVFRTRSDTEVLLQAYLLHGEACVERFEGMWSFALFDGREGKLFLSRDRFAEKPLYYLRTERGLYFGSEIKFLRSLSGRPLTVNRGHLLRYMVNGYKSLYKTPETFYREVSEVPYATRVVVKGDLAPRSERYWRPSCTPRPMTLPEAVEGARERLLESVRIRLRSDVPLAFCLSGGVDSAALVSIAAKVFGAEVATYSLVDPDERYNELGNIRATVADLGCRNTIIPLSPGNALGRLRALVEYHDAPVATISYYIHSLLSEAIAADGYRVAFSGTAADELFTGYYDHFNLHLYEMRGRPDYPRYLEEWRRHVEGFVRNPFLKDPELYLRDPGFRDHIYLNREEFAACMKGGFREEFAEERYCGGLLRNRMLNELFHESIPVILHEDDLNSMMHSIENRSPYLDTRLFEFACSIPAEHLIRDGYGKYVLREAVRGILNEPVRLDRRKKGFNAAIRSIVDLSDPAERDYLLSDGPIFDLVDRSKIEGMLDRDPMPNSYSKFLFGFIVSRMFLEASA